MGETGSRGKEGRDDARWEDDLLLVVYIHLFAFSSLCWRVLQAVGRVGTNWLNDTRMPDSARSLTADWGGLVKEGTEDHGLVVPVRCLMQ